MAQTFRDFMIECELYQHSQECFDLMKEAAELDLGQSYIISQQFLAENAAIMESQGIVFTEGYFMEAEGNEKVKERWASFKSKAGNWFERIRQGLVNFIKKVIAFFVKIRNRFDDVDKKVVKVRKGLSAIADNLTAADANILYSALQIGNNNYSINIGAVGRQSQPYAPKELAKIATRLRQLTPENSTSEMDQNALSIYGKGAATSDTFLKNVLSFALTDTYALVPTDNDTACVSAKDFIKTLESFIKAKKGYEIKNVMDYIEKAEKNARQEGVSINVNSKSITKITESLGEIQKKLENADIFKDLSESSNLEAKEFQDLNAKIITLVGSTMKVYNGYLSYRRSVADKLSDYLDKRSTPKGEE